MTVGTRTGKRHPRRIDVTPTTYQLHAYRASGMTALSCFGELIDNCIGAKARSIDIVIDGDTRTITVTDDGCGMHSAAMAFQPGRHIEHGDEQGSSRYGVGLKDAGWRLGEVIKIVTVRDGRKTVSVADTDVMIRRGKWEVTERVRKTTAQAGTVVTVGRVDFPLSNSSISRLRTELEKLYVDALREGIAIAINGTLLTPADRPRFRSIRESEAEVDGKRFRVRGGILAPGQDSVSSGVTIKLPLRVLCSGERAGLESYDVSQFYAEVTLIEDKDDRQTWFRVTKHKDSLHEKSAVCRKVAEIYADMLRPYTPNHVITIPLPRTPKTEDEGLIIDPKGGIPVTDEGGDVGQQHVEEGGGGGPGGQPNGVSETDDAGKKRSCPKKKRGYDLNVQIDGEKFEAVAECRLGEKSATVILGGKSNMWLGYSAGNDKGRLRDSVSMFAVASGLVMRHEDDPKTPLDFLVDQSAKQSERVLKTLDNLLAQWNPKGK
jgi:hypothetical protein